MIRNKLIGIFIFLCIGVGTSNAACENKNILVGALERTGVVCTPDMVSIEPLPLVLVFHGRGGSGVEMMGATSLHTTWPEAIVVYLDGLTGTSSPFDPKGLKNGWQLNLYDMDNRDVDFVELTLDVLQQNHNIDSQRIFAVGFSNGARFCGVLWALRGDRFKGFAFSSAQADTLIGQADVNNIFTASGSGLTFYTASGSGLTFYIQCLLLAVS